MNEWYYNNEFWDVMSHRLFSGKNPAETKKETEQIINLTGISPNLNILDLCCGQGRHSLELARRGFKVTGVDRTKQYLEKAKEEASQENLSVDFIKDDMRYFRRESHFNAIIIMYTSFGYFEEQAENLQVLRNCYDSLNRAGLLLIDVVGREILKQKFIPRESLDLDGVKYIEERKIIGNWNRVENKWIMLIENQQKEFKFSHWLYSENELKTMLKETGFNQINIFGNLAGASYNQDAERLISVARK